MEATTLTTGCDRLKHAQTYLTEHGWRQGGLRRWVDDPGSMTGAPVGPACLVGALITTKEFEQSADSALLYQGNATLYPGLAEAYKFLGFNDGYDAYIWNDTCAEGQEVVIDRIAVARAKHCEDKNGA